MTYACPVCGHGETAYLRCNHPGCPDGRDPLHPNNLRGQAHRERIEKGESMKTVEDWQEQIAHQRKLSPRYPTVEELHARRRARHAKMWRWALYIAAAYGAYCFLVAR